MKISGFWVLFLMLGSALMFFRFSKKNTSSSVPDMVFEHSGSLTIMATSRKLKENSYTPSMNKKHNVGKVTLDDYHSIDPVPSSKTTVRPGPIEHSSPLIPYIPKPPSPPTEHPKNGGTTRNLQVSL